MDPRTLRRAATATAVALALTVAAGCGDDDEAADVPTPEAQPAPDVTTFEDGDFADLPLPPRNAPVSERTEEDGFVSQSFEVESMPPEEVLEWYTTALAEHDVLETPEMIGTESWRGQWDLDGRELTVAAQLAETLDDNPAAPEVLTQLSLSLAPPEADTNAP
jgi:hypothetical protein